MLPRHLGALVRSRRHLVVLFLLLTFVPSTLLIVFGWRMLDQDRALALQQLQQQREQAADLVATSLQQSLAAAEQSLHDPAGIEALPASQDSVAIVFDAAGVRAFPEDRLVFYPVSSPGAEAPDRVFATAETLEYRQHDSAGAATRYDELSRSSNAAIRAGALIRLARIRREIGQDAAALDIYERIAAMSGVAVDGIPADLMARWARCDLLAGARRAAKLKGEASALYGDLATGKWRLDRTSYELHAGDARRWLGIEADPDSELQTRIALSTAVDNLWRRWRDMAGDEQPQPTREVMAAGGTQWTVLSAGQEDRLEALVAGPSFIDLQWLGPVRALVRSQGLRVALRNPTTPGDGGEESRQFAVDTGLPWTVVIQSADVQAALDQVNGRRTIWLAGLMILGVLVGGGAAIVGRAVIREMAVARVQADFVAAVSHEFRTPLTALQQVTESLADDRVPAESRPDYYRVLQRQTDRLHRLVESLLDFGRMEAGRSPYRLEPTDARELVEAVARQFDEEAAGRGYHVEASLAEGASPIAADRDALVTALWNLLDNAVKYSPSCHTVWLDLAAENAHVEIRVRDRGFGIPREEQDDIFDKFVRGSRAKADSIKGTGIGLAMVRHIVEAHGGDVSVISEPGVGSTFTVTLPTARAESQEPKVKSPELRA